MNLPQPHEFLSRPALFREERLHPQVHALRLFFGLPEAMAVSPGLKAPSQSNPC